MPTAVPLSPLDCPGKVATLKAIAAEAGPQGWLTAGPARFRHSVLFHLRREGLIESAGRGPDRRHRLTAAGRAHAVMLSVPEPD